MTVRAAIGAGALACAMALALSTITPGWAQAPGGRAAQGKPAAGKAKARAKAPAVERAPAAPPATHEVKRGETLFAIARKNRHLRVTMNQMMVAIFQANADAFDREDPNQLRVGSTLRIPERETVAALDPGEAARTVQSWRAKPPLAPPVALPPRETVPTVMIPPSVTIKPEVPAKPRLSREEAQKRYLEGLAQERSGNERAALTAFLEAGEAGHGMAQKRLGEIYDRGNSVVARDYQVALKWYQKAREQGIAIPKPIQLPAGH